MTIKIGDRLPSATLFEMTADGPQTRSVEKLTRGRRIVLFAVPGAFTPTCSARHVPGFVEQHAQFKAKGIDDILCVSVNDAHVMGAWGKSQASDGKVRMLGDGNAEFARAMGLDVDQSAQGRGTRSQRYSLYADDGIVRLLNVEQPGKFDVSDAGTMLIQLDRLEKRHG
jgi:peroxiredoxin